MKTLNKAMRWTMALSAAVLLSTALLQRADAQDQQDDPPSRVARLGYMEGSVSFQPAGESDWVEAVPNRPMTTGDRILGRQRFSRRTRPGVGHHRCEQ